MEVTVFGILIDSSGIQKRKRGKPDWPSPLLMILILLLSDSSDLSFSVISLFLSRHQPVLVQTLFGNRLLDDNLGVLLVALSVSSNHDEEALAHL